ncbi:MAG: TRIC cation channel family protein, partial [Cyanobacteria bacterium P01_F01_bin.4]
AQVISLHREHFWLADAISLAVFTVVGTQVVVQAPAFAPISLSYWVMPPLMGLLTGVGGGILRDLLGAQTPYVMQDHYYALASLIGGGVYSILARVQSPDAWAIGCAIATILLLRILSIHTWVRLKAHACMLSLFNT